MCILVFIQFIKRLSSCNRYENYAYKCIWVDNKTRFVIHARINKRVVYWQCGGNIPAGQVLVERGVVEHWVKVCTLGDVPRPDRLVEFGGATKHTGKSLRPWNTFQEPIGHYRYQEALEEDCLLPRCILVVQTSLPLYITTRMVLSGLAYIIYYITLYFYTTQGSRPREDLPATNRIARPACCCCLLLHWHWLHVPPYLISEATKQELPCDNAPVRLDSVARNS
jgi:hypothetical protein